MYNYSDAFLKILKQILGEIPPTDNSTIIIRSVIVLSCIVIVHYLFDIID